MKKILTIVFVVCILSCNNSNTINNTKETSITVIDSNKIFIDSAKVLIVQSNEYVKKGIRKEMKPSKVNKIVNPLMEKYANVFKRIKPADTTALNDFRIQKINELIDLQVKMDN